MITCFVKNDVPYLTFVLKYFPYRAEIRATSQYNNKKKEAWRESLSEADMGLFNLLRKLAFKTKQKDGMPPYILFTESKFSRHCKRKDLNLFSELMQIEGIGQGKADKYGEDILKISKDRFGENSNVSSSAEKNGSKIKGFSVF
ncbi:MAG: HRDC domain-containing protein [Bdellovibrionales bacterium]